MTFCTLQGTAVTLYRSSVQIYNFLMSIFQEVVYQKLSKSVDYMWSCSQREVKGAFFGTYCIYPLKLKFGECYLVCCRFLRSQLLLLCYCWLQSSSTSFAMNIRWQLSLNNSHGQLCCLICKYSCLCSTLHGAIFICIGNFIYIICLMIIYVRMTMHQCVQKGILMKHLHSVDNFSIWVGLYT